ncbi:protein kinase activating protein dpb11 [Microbotryomycetes sp. JL221]|nr:protein kinase activating protein dpb11 [Microbotryomycetes sp. JL221]
MPPPDRKRFPPGKKGMRQNNGKKPSIKLKPAPAVQPSASRTANGDEPKRAKQRRKRDDNREHATDDEDAADDNGQDNDSNEDERKPLEGIGLTVSGCGRNKTALLTLATKLGATSSGDMTHDTTHLITDTAGSAKYEMAVRLNLKILQPSWLEEVRSRWTSAEKLDFEQIDENHRVKPFYGVVMSLTHFEQGPYKKDLILKLSALGADIRNQLVHEATHLVVASPTSPHSPVPNQRKIESALHDKDKYPNLKIVWEKWVHEVMNVGGRLNEREQFWQWHQNQPEPIEEPLQTFLPERKRKRLLPQNSIVTNLGHDQDEPLLPAHKKAKTRVKMEVDEHGVESLIRQYKADDSKITGRILNKSLSEPAQEMAVEIRQGEMKLGVKSTSVIKALAKKKAIDSEATKAVKSSDCIQAGSKRDLATEKPSASAQDDSAFFEEVSELVEADRVRDAAKAARIRSNTAGKERRRSDPRSSATWWIGLHDPDKRQTAIRVIESNAGEITQDYGEASDRLTVNIGQLPAGVDVNDEKLRSCAWLEHQVVRDGMEQRCVLSRPLPFKGPIKAAKQLKLYFSGISSQPLEQKHVDEFVNYFGFVNTNQLKASTTHWIMPDVDRGIAIDASVDERVSIARQRNIQIVGHKWLREWIEEHGERLEPGQALPMSTKEPETTVYDTHLDGCRIMISPKITGVERQRLVSLAIEQGAMHVRSLEEQPTHLVHIGTRANDLSRVVQDARKAYVHVVHPAWLEKCLATRSRVNESEYPHTFDPKKGLQLNGFVSSQAQVVKIELQDRVNLDDNDDRHSQSSTSVDDEDSVQKQLHRLDEGDKHRPSPPVLESMTNIPRASSQKAIDATDARTIGLASRSPSTSRDPVEPATAVRAMHSPFGPGQADIPSPQMSPIGKDARMTRYSSPDVVHESQTQKTVTAPVEAAKTSDSSTDTTLKTVQPPTKALLKAQTSLLLAQLAMGSSATKTRPRRRVAQQSSPGTKTPNRKELSAEDRTPLVIEQPFVRKRVPGVFDVNETQTQAPIDESLYVQYDDPDEVKAREEMRRMLGLNNVGEATLNQKSKSRRGIVHQDEGDEADTQATAVRTRSSRKSR